MKLLAYTLCVLGFIAGGYFLAHDGHWFLGFLNLLGAIACRARTEVPL